MVSVVSVNFTKFGKLEDDLITLAAKSASPIVEKFRQEIDFVVVSNSYSGEYNGISGLNNLLTTRLSLDTVPSIRVDNTSGSGGSAVLVAKSLIESGTAKNVLVTGAEKMTSMNGKSSTSIIASLLHNEEKSAGISLPSLGGLLTKEYMAKFGASRESIAMVAVKNHLNGSMNQYAQFQKPVSLEQVLNSKIIADPLRIFEFCPVSDGSVSLLLTGDDNAESMAPKSARIIGTGTASGSSSLSSRAELTTIDSVKKASSLAFGQSSKHPDEMDFAELHDMSTILEIVESEDAGFFKKGEGWKAVLEHKTDLNSDLSINPSGGLNSKGHPIGASGVAQAGEVFLQLTNQAAGHQVKNAEMGYSVSMAGFGNSATAFIYEVGK